ncbi:MAG: hypothetical protein E7012_06410 [Alphaproteobacteria bacterium]|nr:hypothetical protein [Alphaproteobacteria bacterium]
MNFIRRYWFGLITGLLVFLCLVIFVLVLISPRQDAQKRGFIPCTEIMAEKIVSCQDNKVICLLGAVLTNTWCDIKVIGQGMADWAHGQQPYPWSNYIFIPEIVEEPDLNDPLKAEYLKNNPNIKDEMEQLKKLNEELENEERQDMQIGTEDKPQ